MDLHRGRSSPGCREQVSFVRSQTFCAPERLSCAFIDGNRLRLTNEIEPGLLSRIAKNWRWMRFTGGGSLTGGFNMIKQVSQSCFCATGNLFFFSFSQRLRASVNSFSDREDKDHTTHRNKRFSFSFYSPSVCIWV